MGEHDIEFRSDVTVELVKASALSVDSRPGFQASDTTPSAGRKPRHCSSIVVGTTAASGLNFTSTTT